MQVKDKMDIKKSTEGKANKSKYYYEFDRNMDNAKQMNQLNSKMLLTKEELGLVSRIPEYYKGKNGYEARKVCDNFNLSYHLGTAVTYILRSYHKHDTPIECLQKAINHLHFEIEKYEELEKGR
ncbi:MAG: hypothetical protein GOVbin2669_29 [Prokaryotic dsDNA virus sp.]|nr:MAG: hypothetical protein GOVbin2669_29 [Prokaryotic dsDNA virus sp.]|tara:strand:+ start:5240 stop:5611 length:372 start_codon:yes stop_codon:yes gene_type:complete